MQNKLQELTDKLYNEGLSKGKQEGEELLAKAKAQVDDMLAKAQAEAAQIIAAAQKQAEEIRTKTASDIKMASSQSIAATKKDIETLIVGKMTGDAVKKTLSSPDFIKDLIKTVAEKFTTDGPVDLNLILPESLKNDLEPFATKELAFELHLVPMQLLAFHTQQKIVHLVQLSKHLLCAFVQVEQHHHDPFLS